MTSASKNTSNEDAASKHSDESSMESVYSSLIKPLLSGLYIVGFLNALFQASVEAYNIRLYAINEYGRVIHEFDPYFNYRAAEVGRFSKKSRNREGIFTQFSQQRFFFASSRQRLLYSCL